MLEVFFSLQKNTLNLVCDVAIIAPRYLQDSIH